MPSMCWAISLPARLVEYLDFFSTSGLADPISLINLNGKRRALQGSRAWPEPVAVRPQNRPTG